MIRRFLCLFGLHKRNRDLVRHEGADLVSVCKYCKTGMTKDFHKGWIVSRKRDKK